MKTSKIECQRVTLSTNFAMLDCYLRNEKYRQFDKRKGCFGAKEIDETCTSCEQIRAAYEDKGWHWNVVDFDICMKGKS